MFSTQVTIGEPEIAAPYDFGFQLRHYVIAPEVREDQTLVEIVRLSSGDLVKVDIESRGTVDAPQVEMTIAHGEPLSSAQVDEVRERVAWHLSLDDDLRSFYAMAAADPVLSASVSYNFGAKGKHAPSMFDGLVDAILFQNTAFRRAYAMRASLAAEFGDPFVVGGRVYTPRRPTSNSLPRRWRRSARPSSATGIATSKHWPRPSWGASTWRPSGSFPAMKPGAS